MGFFMYLIIGNVLGLIGALLMVGIGFMHERRHILIWQNVQFLIMGIGSLVLGGSSTGRSGRVPGA